NTGMINQVTSSSEGTKINNPASGQTIKISAGTLKTQNNATANNLSNNTATSANPINPIRTDAEVLQAIAQLNKNRDKINSLLAANATLTAQIRQQTQAGKYQTITSQSIPGP